MARLVFLLAGTALATICAIALMRPVPEVDGLSDREKLRDLLDPGRAAALACKGTRKTSLAAFLAVASANAAEAAYAREASPVPLYSGLGEGHVPITTDAAAAQAYFDQGLKFSFAFNHKAATLSFRAAQAADPSCAMCYWGEALVLGPNINAPMDAAALAPALEALAAAEARAGSVTPPERALILALSKRYSSASDADRAASDAAYADAMVAVAEAYRDADHILALAAEAIMDTQPWNYWHPGGHEPLGRAGEALALLEKVLNRTPDHPGAIHLYIHMVESSNRPERGEAYADRLAEQMPAAGHIVHMPAHLYYRLGRYADSVRTNVKAIAADEAYFEQAGRGGIYGYGYYPHNVHFVLTSAAMAGDAGTTRRMAAKLAPLIPVETALEVPWIQPVLAAPLFAHARFSDHDTVLAQEPPDARLPYVAAMWHYARGVAHAAAGHVELAEAEAGAIDSLRTGGDFSLLTAGGIPAPNVLELAALVVRGRIAQAEGNHDAAVDAFRRAVAIQDRLPYTEPPYWYYPARQSLGAALLAAGDAGAAVTAFRESLFDAPNNGFALYGLIAAERMRGDEAGAAAARAAFEAAWAGEREPDLGRL